MLLAELVCLAAVLAPGVNALAAPPRAFCQPSSAEAVLEGLGGQGAGGRQPRLVASQIRVRPGQAVQARLLNLTSKTAFYGAEFKIQRYGSTRWVTDPSSPDRLWPRWLGKLHPTRAGRCYRHTVPLEQPPGRYRFLTWIDVESGEKPRAAEFRITD
jgi:hypothetical protein